MKKEKLVINILFSGIALGTAFVSMSLIAKKKMDYTYEILLLFTQSVLFSAFFV